jgi:predicted TIM-barrel fold metal-dependent hydrolase
MKIVDAQVHIWAANTPERPWPARAEPHRAPLGKEELLAEMDKAGVDGVVIVPPSWEAERCRLAATAHRSLGIRPPDPDAPGVGPDRHL